MKRRSRISSSALAAIIPVAAMLILPWDGSSPRSGTGATPVRAAVPAGRPIVVSPGRVELVVSPAGGWDRFGAIGRSPLLTHGGLLVFARGADERIRTVFDGRRRMDTPGGEVPFVARASEGAEHGARFPSPGADDDGDGKTNEDRLDGMDNDGDGAVDEDFAAAGDAMVALRYRAGSDATRPGLSVYEEHCAWSLPHIDGLVVTRYVVRNDGVEALRGVRLGAAFDIPEGAPVSSRALDVPVWGSGNEARFSAHVVEIDGETPLSVIFLVARGDGEGRNAQSWAAGAARADAAGGIERRIQAVLETTGADPGEATSRTGFGRDDGETVVDESPEAVAATGGERRHRGVETAWAVSPDLGILDPGAEVSVFVGLLSPPRGHRSARAIEDALRTVVGDGRHRMIPPPVWSTRRVVWGNYSLRMPDNPDAGVDVTLFDPRDAGVEPSRITYLQRVDLRRTIVSIDAGGNAVFELDGVLPDEFAQGKDVVLHGRLQDGQWFDAFLKPAAQSEAGGDATAWFNEPGALDEALLGGSPNPFRDATTISYEVPSRITDERGRQLEFNGTIETSVKVYDVTGRLVSTLVERAQAPGRYQEPWSARNTAGAAVASGVYYVKLQIGRRFITRRFIQLK